MNTKYIVCVLILAVSINLLIPKIQSTFFKRLHSTMASAALKPRSTLKAVYAQEQSEGAGARVRRSIGTWDMRNFTPFLMLDHFNSSGLNGFPDHPHRGQETITYMIKGQMAHEDFTGSKGILNPGDLQFMTAGRGIVHSEMPVPQPDGSSNVGMQLWVDLPKELKSCEPRYRDLRAAEIPIAKPDDKVTIKVISGESYGVKSVQDLAYTPVDYYHYTVQPGGKFEQPVPEDHAAFLYIMSGNLTVNGKTYPEFHSVFFNKDGNVIQGEVPESSEPADFVLIGGQLLNQPVVQHGPFVECTKEKIYQAFVDYQTGSNGFERSRNWSSSIAEGVTPEIVEQLQSQS